MITVNKETCGKCYACILQCPYNFILEKDNEGFPISNDKFNNKCIECYHCVAVCRSKSLTHSNCSPEDCLEVDKNKIIDSKQAAQFLKTRRSLRAFKNKPVPKEVLMDIMNTTRWSSTATNTQQIKWMIIESPDKVKEVAGYVINWLRELDSEPEMVEEWDNYGIDKVLRGAPHLVIALFDKDRYWRFTEGSSALTYIELAAHSYGLGACWAGYFTKAVNEYVPLKEYLGISENQEVVGAMMIGYPKFKMHRVPPRKELTINWN